VKQEIQQQFVIEKVNAQIFMKCFEESRTDVLHFICHVKASVKIG